MTIECYDTDCLYHSCHRAGEEGPFCYEKECIKAEDQCDKVVEIFDCTKELNPKKCNCDNKINLMNCKE